MAYCREEARRKALEMIQPLRPDTQSQLNRAINFAMEELRDLERQMKEINDKLQENVIYSELKPPLMESLNVFAANTSYLIQRTYTEEELTHLPTDAYNEVVESQRKRAGLLRAIAGKYNL